MEPVYSTTYTYVSPMSFILFELVCFAVLFLLSKFVFKLKTLTAISLSAFCVSALPWMSILSGIGPLGGPRTIPETMAVEVRDLGPLGGPRTNPETMTVQVRDLGPDTNLRTPLLLISLLVIVVCGGILAIQFFRWASSSDNATVNAAERERILQMVENGKISAEEGSELLDAMGRSSALRGQEKFSRLDIVMLVGAALVMLGFFLPWVYIQMRGPLGKVSGYQAGYNWQALGWVIFVIGVLSTVPIFVTPKDFLYKISMLQIFLMLIGVVLVIIVLARVGSNLGAGIIFCLVGFVVELVAAGAKFRKLAA